MTPVRETLIVDDVTFAVRRSARRRTIGISIPREGLPVVAAPPRCSRRTLEAALRGKLPWVRRKLGERDALAQLPPHRYETGERFPYLGREYELVLIDDGPAHRRTARGGAAIGHTASTGVRQLVFDLSGDGAGHSTGSSAVAPGDASDDGQPLRLRDGRFELAALGARRRPRALSGLVPAARRRGAGRARRALRPARRRRAAAGRRQGHAQPLG